MTIHKYSHHHFSIGVCSDRRKGIDFDENECLDSRNYNQEGYGEFGFQVALSERPEQILLTSPGSFYFRGKDDLELLNAHD